jgi:aryl-alcohol dehydrogenase-like predicted oxidoreductase
MTQTPHDGGLSRRWIVQACEDSLRRLATDYIDIYYLHRDFSDASLEEAIAALGDLIRAGKIRYIGVSNFRGWRIAEIVNECEAQGVPAPIVCQPYYNLLNRMPEVEILPACDYYGLSRALFTDRVAYSAGNTSPANAGDASRGGRRDSRIMKPNASRSRRTQDHAEKRTNAAAPGVAVSTES